MTKSSLKKLALFASFLIMLCSTASPFDGNRKGFVLGGGLGYGYSENLIRNRNNYIISESRGGYGLQFVAGYGFDSQNIIEYDVSTFIYKNNGSSFIHGYRSLIFVHFISNNEKSFYGSVGVTKLATENSKFRAIYGLGYRITSQVELGISYRTKFDFSRQEYITLLVSFIAY